MYINLLPREYQDELKYERISRFLAISGAFVFLMILASIILLLPSRIFLALEKTELARQLEAVKNSSAFSRVEQVETEIKNLNADIASFGQKKEGLYAIAPAIASVLNRRPDGIKITGIIFSPAEKNKEGSSVMVVSGSARNRDLLLAFTKSNETNPFLKKVRSPITNLLKESDFDYSLVLEMK